MKTSKAIILAITAFALCLPPALAQRAVSRGGGSSRSVSSPSRSVSSPSRSASSSSHSFSSPSRSVSSSSRSVSTPSRSSSSSRTFTSPSSTTFHNPNHSSSSVSRSSSSRSVSMPSRSVAAPTRSGGFERGAAVRAMGRNEGFPKATPFRSVSTPSAPGPAGAPAPSVRATTDHRHGSYARPGRPGVLPPSHRPIHPAPYFHHPWHHRMVHCRPIIWNPIPPRPWHWPGFWLFCNSYWYDYHVTDVVVVRQYVQDTYKVDIVTYGISGDIMYAIVRDGGDTFLQVYDKEDHLLAEQKINKKYCNMVIDPDNGGCWISKKNEKDPLLFIWAEGQLLIYEAD